jgi:phage-related protein
MEKIYFSIIVAALLCSCSVTQPAWDGVESAVDSAVTTTENVVVDVYQGAKSLVTGSVDTVEGVVEGGYTTVTEPFFGSDE